MARVRAKTAELAQLLDSIPQPLYVLDNEGTIVFCNAACLEWLGRTADELLGRRCGYHSAAETSAPDAAAAGLCPPPGPRDKPLVATVAAVQPDGRLQRRRARFIPLGEGPAAGMLALVEPREASPQEAVAPEDAESAQLHERIRAFRQEAARRWRAGRLIGDSPAIRRARAQIEVAAASRAAVVVAGPPGSGRQHVAAAIHYGGPEPVGPLMSVACAALGDSGLRGALASVAARTADPRGRGTLLLTDVDRLPPEHQAELAALVGRAGALRPIATAHEPLVALAARKLFREDLAAALSTIVIELPALSQRRGDLPLLAQLYVEEANARGEKQIAGLSPEALACLDAYGWPGNVDELIHVVVEAHEQAEGPQIALADLPERIRLAAQAAARPRRPEETIVLDRFLGEIERELIQRALARAKGNKTKAARLLGMTRPRLYRRLVQLGLEPPQGDDDSSSGGRGDETRP